MLSSHFVLNSKQTVHSNLLAKHGWNLFVCQLLSLSSGNRMKMKVAKVLHELHVNLKKLRFPQSVLGTAEKHTIFAK